VSRSRPRRPLGVGASVMLAAQPSLRRVVKVDAAVGRQAPDILDRLRSYRRAGDLPAAVAVQLGENGPITDADMTSLRRVLEGVDRVVLVNVRIPRSWGDAANDVLADAAKDWPQARIADWHAASAPPGVLYPDGTHPTPKGHEIYAQLVERALGR
jgi:lysophospholipase L1-like esterase